LKNGQGFEVLGLRKKIVGLQNRYVVALGFKHAEIPGEA
jgi:hypothetical protein